MTNASNSPDPREARLLDRGAIEAHDSAIPAWVRTSYEAFKDRVLADDYPCYFATLGQKRGELRYTWADCPTDQSLPKTVKTFCALSESSPKTRYALVIFVKPEAEPGAKDHDGYRDDFWHTLNHVHHNDPEPWPNAQPTDPANPLWEFCAFGVPSFVFGAAPSYVRRRARNLGPGLVLLLQPRTVFRGIEGGTKGGDAARKKIRERLVRYDGVAPHVDFGDYGDPSTNEWKQYFVSDDDVPETGPCPFVHIPCRGPRLLRGSARTDLRALVPEDSEVALQHDAPRKRHGWHQHGRRERLTVLDGAFTFRTLDEEWGVCAGDAVEIPPGALHESEAGDDGAVYVIQPLRD